MWRCAYGWFQLAADVDRALHLAVYAYLYLLCCHFLSTRACILVGIEVGWLWLGGLFGWVKVIIVIVRVCYRRPLRDCPLPLPNHPMLAIGS